MYIEQYKPDANSIEKLPFPPILKIIKTPAFIGLLFAHISNNWGMFVIMKMIPTYLNNIHHIPLKTVSIFV